MEKLGYIIMAWNKEKVNKIKYLTTPKENHENTPDWVWTDVIRHAKIFSKKRHCLDIISNITKDNLGGLIELETKNNITFKILHIVKIDMNDRKTRNFSDVNFL